MKIAILGPPGAGKSKLARGLAAHLGGTVLDNYIQRLQAQTGLALGPWSSYSENFMVSGVRQAAIERAETRKPEHLVVVGSIIDTITYAAVRSDVTMSTGPEAARALYDTARAAMQGLALCYQETWDFHLAFHLGYQEGQRAKREGTWELALDEGYAAVVESFEVPYVYGLNGSHDDRLRIAKEVVDIARENSPEEQEKRGSGQPSPQPSPADES